MGMEPIGLAVPNLEELWIDPWEYRRELETATLLLARRGMAVSVYNHQLCTVSEAVRPFCRKSISDWKNDYSPLCSGCRVRDDCGGFFSSSLVRRHSAHVRAIE